MGIVIFFRSFCGVWVGSNRMGIENFFGCGTDARQNNDYFAGYSIGSLQGRKHKNYSKIQRKTLYFNENINNQ
jgi:hypothetical protein